MSNIHILKNRTMIVATILSVFCVFAADDVAFTVGEREVVATKKQLDTFDLKWFIDGNLGVVNYGNRIQLYGANGSQPVRVTGTPQDLLQKVEPVTIITEDKRFQYLSGGPLYRDSQSKRIFLFYHAEIYQGNTKNFYSVLGLSIQTDANGLIFKDLGPIFMANVPNEKTDSTVEICGSPYMIKDGYFYVYGRDILLAGSPKHSNLSVARAKVADVVSAGLKGKSVEWMKYYNNAFSELAVGGKSSPLEKGNPGTRWMDVSYNATIEKYIIVVAANTSFRKVELFITWSDDGIIWAKRRKLANENGESFYPSIVGFQEDSRQTEGEFYVYYTFSTKGGWKRWSDAVIVRRKITLTAESPNKTLEHKK